MMSHDAPLRFPRTPVGAAFACVLFAWAGVGAGSAAGFHDGGVASCGGCHVMHESADGQSVVAESDLLLGASASDTCLLCHSQGMGAVHGGAPLAPGPERGAGNFVFLLEDQLNDGADAATHPIGGEAAGHSIVAPGAGLFPDPRWSTAPGGSFPSAELGCTSCHDPHGNTNFRMLHGRGTIQAGTFFFNAPAPEAEGVALDGPAESAASHTAYRSGWTQWCGNCHGNYHEESGDWRHPSGVGLTQLQVTQYNRYLGDAGTNDGVRETAYLPQVPFEDPSVTVSSSAGPSAWSRVSCITCHRAHASSAPAAGRWDFRVTHLQDDGVVSGSYPLPNPYAGPQQGSLCRKCHVDKVGGEQFDPFESPAARPR